MHRLFVALRPPPPLRARLLAAMAGVPGARWQDDDQLHLTLRFIGEVDRHRAEDVATALAQVRAPALALTLGATGLFDRRGRPDALWVGVGPHEPLQRLHDKIDRAIVGVGLEPERRAYRPHITLARFGRSAGPSGPLPPLDVAGAGFAATHFTLFESSLGHAGATYEEVARFPLVQTPAASSDPATSPR